MIPWQSERAKGEGGHPAVPDLHRRRERDHPARRRWICRASFWPSRVRCSGRGQYRRHNGWSVQWWRSATLPPWSRGGLTLEMSRLGGERRWLRSHGGSLEPDLTEELYTYGAQCVQSNPAVGWKPGVECGAANMPANKKKTAKPQKIVGYLRTASHRRGEPRSQGPAHHSLRHHA